MSPQELVERIDTRIVDKLRKKFRKLQDNAAYGATREDWLSEVRKLAGSDPTPEKWVEAAERATVKCGACCGSGVYYWGACVNGKMTHAGPCFRCGGSGRQGQDDFHRNRTYDNHRKVV